LTPPPGYMAALRALADKHGILLIADEVGGLYTRSTTQASHNYLQ